MPGPADVEPADAPETAGGPSKVALVIATSQYIDSGLRRLRAPGHDANQLAQLLMDPTVGGFDVITLLNSTSDGVRQAVADFCADRDPDDLMLVYLSCHGLLDDAGRLYYATMDTQRRLLTATALPAAWLNERLEDCRCKRQILMLDCCHSGAFHRGSKGDAELALRQRFQGRGRAVLTASKATEYSFEGDTPIGTGVTSVFTQAVIHGLETGDADLDGDAVISVSELYRYAFDRVRRSGHPQTPELWTSNSEGDLVIARGRRGYRDDQSLVPEDVQRALQSQRTQVREGAVAALTAMLADDDASAGAARRALQLVASSDTPHLAALARAALDGVPAALPAARETATRSSNATPVAAVDSKAAEPATTSFVQSEAPQDPQQVRPGVGAGPSLRRLGPAALLTAAVILVLAVLALMLVLHTAGSQSPSAFPSSSTEASAVVPSVSPSVAVASTAPTSNSASAPTGAAALPSVSAQSGGGGLGPIASTTRGVTPHKSIPGSITSPVLPTTQPATPRAIPSGARVGNPGQTTMWIWWTDADGATRYRVGWRALTSGHNTMYWESTGENYPLRGANNPLQLTGLDPDTPYQFWVTPYNQSGDGPTSKTSESTLP